MPYKDPNMQRAAYRKSYHKRKDSVRLYQNNRDRIAGMAKSEYHKFWYNTHKDERNTSDRIRAKNPNRRLQFKLYKIRNPLKVLQYNLKLFKKLGSTLNLEPYVVMGLLMSWSKAVKHRDNNKCQICGMPAEEAHHIFPKALYPQLALNINNGISLCKEHHYEAEGRRLI